jgi:hypothetical protein
MDVPSIRKAPDVPGPYFMDAPVRLSASDVEPHRHAAISNGVNVKLRSFNSGAPIPSQPMS